MARSIRMDSSETFRAVVTFKGWKDQPVTKVEGPYGKIGAARARVTYWRNSRRYHGGFVDGYVERAVTVWERVDA